MYNYLPTFTFLVAFFTTSSILNLPIAVTACSSRTIPRPRPSTSSSISASPPATTAAPPTTTLATTTTTTPRPNITFPTYKCPASYDQFYCMNSATCFIVKIGESAMFNCECIIGFGGPRCEFKEIDGSYIPVRTDFNLEKASIASGATCALLFMFFICLTLYLRYDHYKLKCIDDDDMLIITDEQNAEFDCRYCYESSSSYCCDANCNESNDTDLLSTDEKFRPSTLRQYIENISPLSFAIKRTTKL